MKINITRNGKTFSIESEDAAGVPDVTEDAGPNLMTLTEDAQKPASDKEAEFDSNVPATQAQTEEDDKTESVEEKAAEAYGIAALLKKTDPKVLAKVKKILTSKESEDNCEGNECPTPAPAPAPIPENSNTDEGVGEVTQSDGATTIQANGLTITIEDDVSKAPVEETPAEEPSVPETPAEPDKSEDCGDPSQGPAQSSIESFFANLNLNDL